jgi:hypothetical protein
MGEGRPDSRSQPYPPDREPPGVRRRVEQGPPPGGERETRTTIWPPVRGAGAPPPQHTAGRPPMRPAPRDAEQMTISVAEFRDLENRVRELERMLAERHDFREPPRQTSRPPVIYR